MPRLRAASPTATASTAVTPACAKPKANWLGKRYFSIQHLCDWANPGKSSGFKARDARGEPPGLIQIMCHEYRGNALSCDFVNHRFDVRLRSLIERGGRFIQQ